MAIVKEINCPFCGETKHEARSNNDNALACHACEAKVDAKKEREWKAGRKGLTVEERLRELEDFMYHHGEHYKGPLTF